jgi:hypothetical protein
LSVKPPQWHCVTAPVEPGGGAADIHEAAAKERILAERPQVLGGLLEQGLHLQ